MGNSGSQVLTMNFHCAIDQIACIVGPVIKPDPYHIKPGGVKYILRRDMDKFFGAAGQAMGQDNQSLGRLGCCPVQDVIHLFAVGQGQG